jgi:hypothetical protein
MKNVLPIALAAPMFLLGAAYPTDKDKEYGPTSVIAPAPEALTYRPCRPGPGDDRCIQLYERGVRASYARWQRNRGVEPAPAQVAMGGPIEERAYRPRRRHGGEGHGAGGHGGGHGEGHRDGGGDHRCHSESSRDGGDARGM